MKAVILVGGEGTRLRPLTVNLPKPMLPVVNRPFLEHVIEYLKGQGIGDVILSMGYRSDVIEEYFGDGKRLGVDLRLVVESTPLGTAGGVKNVEQFLDGTFLVLNGDIMTDLDLRAMIAFHRERGSKATISLTPVDDPTAYGLVETDAQGRVQRFIEKPRPEDITTNLINAGTYVLEREVLDLIPSAKYHMFERGVFPDLLSRNHPIYGYRSNSYWIDIGTPAKYLSVNRDILHGRVARLQSELKSYEGIRVGEGADIDPSAVLVGPVILGQRVKVGARARVTGPTVIGDDSVIGPDSVVEESILWSKVRIAGRVQLKGAILGRDTVVEQDSSILGGAIVSDSCSVGKDNKLDRGIRVWPGHSIGPRMISF